MPIPESLPPAGTGGAALAGAGTGGLGAGRLGIIPLLLLSLGWKLEFMPGTGGGARGFSKLVSWFDGKRGLAGGLIIGVTEP